MRADDRLTVDQLAALAPGDSVTIESGAESAGIATRPAPSSGWTVRTLSFIDPEVTGHLRDRLAGLERQPDRTGFESSRAPVLPHIAGL